MPLLFYRRLHDFSAKERRIIIAYEQNVERRDSFMVGSIKDLIEKIFRKVAASFARSYLSVLEIR
jgi:competence CoiA-like predicted nuclease